jgi:biotin carboxylase
LNKAKLALAIGAGIEQLGGIRKAQKMGYRVLALDGSAKAPGLCLADEARVVDLRDEHAVVSIAREAGVTFTLPLPIGRILTTQGAVNDALGLLGVTRKSASFCTDKALFNRLLRNAGISLPSQQNFTNSESLCLEDGLSWPYPVVLKPSHGAGSRGVRVLRNRTEWLQLKLLFEAHRSLYEDGAVVEAFIDGKVLGIDGAVVNSKAIITLIREKLMTPLPYRVELAYRAPALLSSKAVDQIDTVFQLAVNALGLDNCVFHSDAIWTMENELVIIELSARPAGLMITQKMVPACKGIDFISEAILLSLTGSGNFASTHERPTLLHYWYHRDGRVCCVPTIDQLISLPNVISAEIGVKQGDVMTLPKSVSELLPNGYILLSADSWVEIETIMQKAASLFKITHYEPIKSD